MQKACREQAKELYTKGYKISEIARTCGLSAPTIYKYKARDKAAGIDWDVLELARRRDSNLTKASEARFISTLIDAFEGAFAEIREQPPAEQLKLLSQYTETYYKLKAPLKVDGKQKMLEGAQEAINAIADIAKEEGNLYVTDFLNTHADLILKKCLK